MNIQECLLKMTELTSQNLTILKALNESFFTKQTHTLTEVAGERFVIPSFISLENKINHLQDAFDGLVHASKSGEAWMNFDGNSKHIVLQGFSQAPNPIEPKATSNFYAEKTHPFKDLLSPQPYLNFDLSDLSDNITQVIVKKIVPYNSNLIAAFQRLNKNKGMSSDASFVTSYGEIYAILQSYGSDMLEGRDYAEYDTVYDMPVRQITCDGNYVIEEILDDTIDANLDEYITVKIVDDNDHKGLLYTLADGITTDVIPVGAELITYDGACKLRVEMIYPNAYKMRLKVLHGSYVNLVADTGDSKIVSDYAKLRFLRPSQTIINQDRQLHVPLEEDKYVFICIAPLNSAIRTQSMWGNGLFVATDLLTMIDNDQQINFRDYYNENVNNIGDALVEMMNISSPSITKYDPKAFSLMTGAIPELNPIDNETLQVVQINKHLNDSEAATNIRSLYKQKKQYQIDLQEVQTKLQSLQAELSQISFDDVSGTRALYTAQITDLKKQQNDLITSINKSMDAISLAANNTELPISSAKYHVRGYFDVMAFLKQIEQTLKDNDDLIDIETAEEMLDHVIGIEVQYRYKNPDHPNANVAVIQNYLHTEWLPYNPPYREKVMIYKDGRYITKFVDVDEVTHEIRSTDNNVKFNQIDVPISQGEIVDIRVRLVWAFGYPYTKITSQWSTPATIEFPPELVKDLTIASIIDENNSDIENYRFEKILQEDGVTSHIDDAFQDQDITYYHKPENIASGFYTEERRVIPLRDKLASMSSDLTRILDTIEGTFAESLEVSFVVDGTVNKLDPGISNVIHLPAYSSIKMGPVGTGGAFKYKKDGAAFIYGSLEIKNVSSHTAQLFSCYPGPYTESIYDWTKEIKNDESSGMILATSSGEEFNLRTPYAVLGNVANNNALIADGYEGDVDDHNFLRSAICLGCRDLQNGFKMQTGNQWILFVTHNIYTGKSLYTFNQHQSKNIETFKHSGYNIEHGFCWYKENNPKGNLGIRLTNSWYPRIKKDEYDLGVTGIFATPYLNDEHQLAMPVDDVMTKKILAPGDSLTVPVLICYKLDPQDDFGRYDITEASYPIAFVLRNSLFSDPMYYEMRLYAKYDVNLEDSLSSQKQRITNHSIKYNIVSKR